MKGEGEEERRSHAYGFSIPSSPLRSSSVSGFHSMVTPGKSARSFAMSASEMSARCRESFFKFAAP